MFDRACGAAADPLCVSNEDCTSDTYGACIAVADFGECQCAYGCVSDADCPSGKICACGGDAPGYPAFTSCISAIDCTTSADCERDACRLGLMQVCQPRFTLGCATDADTCVSDDDCMDGNVCFPGPDPGIEGEWACAIPLSCG